MSTTILPFPSSDGLTRILGDWKDIATILRFATLFRGKNCADAHDMVREALSLDAGADSVAQILEGMGDTVKALRSAAAELAGVDRLLAEASDRVLTEAGL